MIDSGMIYAPIDLAAWGNLSLHLAAVGPLCAPRPILAEGIAGLVEAASRISAAWPEFPLRLLSRRGPNSTFRANPNLEASCSGFQSGGSERRGAYPILTEAEKWFAKCARDPATG